MATQSVRVGVTAGVLGDNDRPTGSVSGLTEAATLDTSVAAALALYQNTLEDAVTAAIAAAQAIGTGDASVENLAVEAAWDAYIAAAAGYIDVNTERAAMDTDTAAAVAIGVGNSSVEVDAVDASWVAFLAAASIETELAAVDTGWTAYKTAADAEAGAGSGVELSWDDAQITTIGQLRKAVEHLLKVAEGTGTLTT